MPGCSADHLTAQRGPQRPVYREIGSIGSRQSCQFRLGQCVASPVDRFSPVDFGLRARTSCAVRSSVPWPISHARHFHDAKGRLPWRRDVVIGHAAVRTNKKPSFIAASTIGFPLSHLLAQLGRLDGLSKLWRSVSGASAGRLFANSVEQWLFPQTHGACVQGLPEPVSENSDSGRHSGHLMPDRLDLCQRWQDPKASMIRAPTSLASAVPGSPPNPSQVQPLAHEPHLRFV